MDERELTGESDAAVEKPAPAPPSMVDGEEHPVDPRTVRIARIVGILIVLPFSAVPLILLTIGWALGGIPGKVYLPLIGGVLLLATFFVLLAYKWPAVRHRHLRYTVHEGGLRIRRGVFWRKSIWIPISRVQHTDVSQGPLQRKYELASITVHTAGTAGASISLAGLEHGIATRLNNHLRPDRAKDAN